MPLRSAALPPACHLPHATLSLLTAPLPRAIFQLQFLFLKRATNSELYRLSSLALAFAAHWGQLIPHATATAL